MTKFMYTWTILVWIFSHLDWIRRFTMYNSIFSRNTKKLSKKKFAVLIITLWIKLFKIVQYLWRSLCTLEQFWFGFSRIWTEYGDLLCITSYSVEIRQNMHQRYSVFRITLFFQCAMTCNRLYTIKCYAEWRQLWIHARKFK